MHQIARRKKKPPSMPWHSEAGAVTRRPCAPESFLRISVPRPVANVPSLPFGFRLKAVLQPEMAAAVVGVPPSGGRKATAGRESPAPQEGAATDGSIASVKTKFSSRHSEAVLAENSPLPL